MILIVAGICIFGALKVLALVRGGLLSKSWQMFIGGFSALAFSQLLLILNAMDVINLPSFVVPACLMLMSGLFLWGIFETKRILG